MFQTYICSKFLGSIEFKFKFLPVIVPFPCASTDEVAASVIVSDSGALVVASVITSGSGPVSFTVSINTWHDIKL